MVFSVQSGGVVYGRAFLYTSDARLKNNIKPIDNSLWKVLQLTGVSFNWNSGDRKGQPDIGVIAQDVQKIAPEAVRSDSNGMLSVDYPRLVPILINALKEEDVKVEALKAIVCRDHPTESLCQH